MKSPDTVVDGENLTRDPSPEGDGNDSSLRSVDAPERDPAVSEENSHPIKSDGTPIKREPPADEPVAGSSANVPAPSASAEARKRTRAPAAPAPRTLRSAARRAAASVTYLYEVPVETVAPGDFEKHIPAQKRARNSRSNARPAGPLEPPARNAPALESENNEAAPEPPPSRNLRSTTLSRSAARPIEVEVPKLDPPKRKRGRPKLQKTIDAERERERKRRIRAEASALRRLLIESQKQMKQNSRKKNARKSRDSEVDFPAAASQSTVKNISDSVESKQSEPLDLSKRMNNNGSELLKILTDPQIHSNKRKQHLLLQKRIKQEMIDEHYEKTASNEANKSISWHIPEVSLPSIKQEFATPRTQQSTIKKEYEHPIIPSDFDKENDTTDQVEVHQQLMTGKVINQQLHEIHVPNAVKNLQELPHPYDSITQKQYHNGKQIKQELVDQQIEKSTTIDAQIQSSWHFPENNEHRVAIERFETPSIDHEYVTRQTIPQMEQHSIKQEPSEYPNIPIEIDEVTEITNRVEVHQQLVNGEEIHTQLQEIHVQNTVKDATITQKQQLQAKPIKQEMIDQQFEKSTTVDAQKRTSCHLPEENKYHVNIEQHLIKQEQPEYPDIPIEFDEIMTDQLEGHNQSTNREPIHSQSQEVHGPKTVKSNREIFLEIQHTHDSLTQMQQLHEKQTKQVTKEQQFEKYAIDAHKSGSWHRPQEKEYHVNVEHLKTSLYSSIPQEDLTQQAAPQMQQQSIKQEQPDLPTIPIEFDEVNEMTDQLELRQRSIKQEITHPQCHVQNADKEELVINLESQNTHSHYITQKRLLQEFQQIKQKLIDPQSEKPATVNTHKSNSWHLPEEINHQKDFEHFKALSARHENVTRHTTPQIQPYSMKQESSEPQIIPIEFDEVKDVTDQLEVGHQSIDRNVSHAQYQELYLKNAIKKEALGRDLDVAGDNHTDLDRLHQYQNLPAMLSQLQKKYNTRELTQKSTMNEINTQQPITNKPYWAQLDVSGVQQDKSSETQSLANQRRDLNGSTEQLQHGEIKRELLHQPSPFPEVPLELPATKRPAWHQPEIRCPDDAGKSFNTRPPHQQNPMGTPLERQNLSSWYQAVTFDRNKLGIPSQTLTQQPTPQEIGVQQYGQMPEIPILPPRKEPYWRELDMTRRQQNDAADLMRRHQSVKQEPIHQQQSLPVQEHKNESIHGGYGQTDPSATHQYGARLRELMGHREHQNNTQQLINPEFYLRQAGLLKSISLDMQQPLHTMKREQNFYRPYMLPTQQYTQTNAQETSNLWQQRHNRSHPTCDQTATRPLPVPEIPLQQTSRQTLERSYQNAQPFPNSYFPQRNILTPGLRRDAVRSPQKRSEKNTSRNDSTPTVPPRAPLSLNPFWHQQRLGVEGAPTPGAPWHQRYDRPADGPATPGACGLHPAPPARGSAGGADPAAAARQRPGRPPQRRNARKQPSKAPLAQHELQWQQQTLARNLSAAAQRPGGPRHPLQLPTDALAHAAERDLPSSWRQWQPLASPRRADPPPAAPRAERKPPPPPPHRQQENELRAQAPPAADGPAGRILRTALTVNNSNFAPCV